LTLESNKILGGVGTVLLAIPFGNLIGIILLLIAMKGIADDYNNPDIFKMPCTVSSLVLSAL
jgi:uncharacterized membrane protein